MDAVNARIAEKLKKKGLKDTTRVGGWIGLFLRHVQIVRTYSTWVFSIFLSSGYEGARGIHIPS